MRISKFKKLFLAEILTVLILGFLCNLVVDNIYSKDKLSEEKTSFKIHLKNDTTNLAQR